MSDTSPEQQHCASPDASLQKRSFVHAVDYQCPRIQKKRITAANRKAIVHDASKLNRAIHFGVMMKYVSHTMVANT